MITEYILPQAVEHIPGDTFSVSGGLLIHRRAEMFCMLGSLESFRSKSFQRSSGRKSNNKFTFGKQHARAKRDELICTRQVARPDWYRC